MKKRKIKRKRSLVARIKKFFIKFRDSFFEEVEDSGNSKTSFSIIEVILIILISILFGIIIGYIITYSQSPIVGKKANKNISEIVNTYNMILDNYYGDVDQDKLSDGAIKGMMDSIDDPYTNYMDNEVSDEFNMTVDGSFVGIGVVIQYEEDEYNHIIEVYKDSPAEKSGLEVGDILLKVGNKDVKGLYGTDITKLIKGKVGSKVKITVKRGDTEKKFTVKRDTIEIDNVTGRVIPYEDNSIGYIKIDNFSENSYSQFKKVIKRLEKKDINSLIIDVRDNPGGHLKQTREILSLFFNKKTVLYRIQTKEKTTKVYSKNNDVRDYPVVILINEASASASEIMASCFKENYKDVKIVGKKSYGKGTVQKSESLTTGSSIKFTTEKWLTSKGKWLNEKGVKPDVLVDQGDEYQNNPNFENDIQLHEALKITGNKD